MATTTVILNPCVHEIICGLSRLTISALRAAIEAQIVAIQAQIVVLTEKLLVLDVLTLPVEATKTVVDAAVNEVKAVENLIPIALVLDCADVGQFKVAFDSQVDRITAEFDDVARDLTRFLSLKKEIEALKAQLSQILDQYNAVLAVLEACP